MTDAPRPMPEGERSIETDVATVDATRPIFVVGCGHSGTTLLTAMLDTHPRIHAFPGESKVFYTNDPRRRIHVLAGLVAAAARLGKTRIAEKTPRHVHSLDAIVAMLPSSRIILMIRDGRDVACSLARRVGSLDSGIRRWREDNEAGLAAAEAHPDHIMTLRYEALIEDPEAALRGVCAFVDEAFDPVMLRYHEVERHWFGTTSRFDPDAAPAELSPEQRGALHLARRNHQINVPLFDPRGEWRGLPEEDRQRLARELGPMLERLGYGPD